MTPTISPRTKSLARRLQASLEVFPLAAGTDITTVTYFLTVAQHPEGINSDELARLTGLARSSVSRNGDVLGELHWRRDADGRRRPGLGLVSKVPDPLDSRKNIYRMTPEGARKLRAMTAIIEGLEGPADENRSE